MRVHVGEVGDGDSIAEHDAATIVEQHVAMHDDIVSHLEVVPEGELDVVEGLEVAATAPKDMLGQQTSEWDAELHVVSQRRLVEHLPEPDQRLDAVVPLLVDLRVVLRLQCDVARIQVGQGHPGRLRELLHLPVGILGEVNVTEHVPAEIVAV